MLFDLRITLIFNLIKVSTMSIPSTTPINGVIEGFYWSPSNAVKGEYDLFTKQQRDQLIASIDGDNNYYFHCPQDSEQNPFTMTLWNSQRTADWADTVAKAPNVSIVMGLRPRWIETVQKSFEQIQPKLVQWASVGIRYYILCWDDAGGAGTDAQMLLQKELINTLIDQVKYIELIGIIPAYYARSQITDATHQAWAKKLEILNEVSSNVRFFVTGSEVVPSSMDTNDVPSLTHRQFIFFDNWIAVDSNARVTMTWPPNRHPNIYKASQSVSGSVLNLAYPPERIIHQIYALKQRIRDQYDNINSDLAAKAWANYLITNDFYSADSFEPLKDTLQSLINHGYENNAEILQHYPLLQTIFTN